MIGFFDSGVGGLTIAEEVHKLPPQYNTIYLGDTARSPYGEKTHDQLVEFTWQGAQWLFKKGCRLVIVACNSASSSALREIQQTKLGPNPPRRILGVIRPTVEELARRDYKTILVLSTEATKKSRAYQKEFQKENPQIKVISHACPTWVPMIEAGESQTPKMRREVAREITAAQNEALKPTRQTNSKPTHPFAAVLLACTHYPYVKPDVEAALAKTNSAKIPVFNQGEIVAASLADYLTRHPEIESKLPKAAPSKPAQHTYFTTGSPARAQTIASRFGYSISFQQARLP